MARRASQKLCAPPIDCPSSSWLPPTPAVARLTPARSSFWGGFGQITMRFLYLQCRGLGPQPIHLQPRGHLFCFSLHTREGLRRGQGSIGLGSRGKAGQVSTTAWCSWLTSQATSHRRMAPDGALSSWLTSQATSHRLMAPDHLDVPPMSGKTQTSRPPLKPTLPKNRPDSRWKKYSNP